MAKCRFLTGVRAMTLMSEHALKHALANFSMWGTCMLADLYILKTFFYTTNADLRSCNDHWFIKPKLLISIFDENAFFTWSQRKLTLTLLWFKWIQFVCPQKLTCWKFDLLCDSANIEWDLDQLRPWGDYT